MGQKNGRYYDNVELMMENEIITRQSFTYINVIGRGGFGKVWKVIHKKSQKIYAMKEMLKCKVIDKHSDQSIKNERSLLCKMFHPFIINMHYSFQDKDYLYIVLDYLSGGDLRYHFCYNDYFSEEQSKFFLCCLILALEYIHSNNILHRDVKPENLVFDESGYLKLTDFGIAKLYFKDKDNSIDTSGTPGYMSPEVLCSLKHSYSCDYYALGIIGYEFMYFRRPFNGRSRKEVRDEVLAKQPQITPQNIKSGWSLEYADFINGLIQRKPEKRLGNNSVDEIKQHPLLKYFNWKDLYLHKLESPFIPPKKENIDVSFCNAPTKVESGAKERYKDIVKTNNYQTVFRDFLYYDRNRDNLINSMINKELSMAGGLSRNIQEKALKKPNFSSNSKNTAGLVTLKKGRNKNHTNNTKDNKKGSKTINNDNNSNEKQENGHIPRSFSIDNLNDMISQYKTNKDEKETNNVNLEPKACINPHLIYRALEQKELECFNNDEIKQDIIQRQKRIFSPDPNQNRIKNQRMDKYSLNIPIPNFQNFNRNNGKDAKTVYVNLSKTNQNTGKTAKSTKNVNMNFVANMKIGEGSGILDNNKKENKKSELNSKTSDEKNCKKSSCVIAKEEEGNGLSELKGGIDEEIKKIKVNVIIGKNSNNFKENN